MPPNLEGSKAYPKTFRGSRILYSPWFPGGGVICRCRVKHMWHSTRDRNALPIHGDTTQQHTTTMKTNIHATAIILSFLSTTLGAMAEMSTTPPPSGGFHAANIPSTPADAKPQQPQPPATNAAPAATAAAATPSPAAAPAKPASAAAPAASATPTPAPMPPAPAQAAPAASQKPAPAARTARVHQVARGDTLSGIAHKYRVPLRLLISHNQPAIKDPNTIRIGQTVAIPAIPAKSVPAELPPVAAGPKAPPSRPARADAEATARGTSKAGGTKVAPKPLAVTNTPPMEIRVTFYDRAR